MMIMVASDLCGSCRYCYKLTPDRQQSKMLILSTNVDQQSLETEFSIAICRLTGNKWQSKTLFLVSFETCLSIVKRIFDCSLSGVKLLLLSS